MSVIVESQITVIAKADLRRGYYRLTLAPFSKIRSIKPGQFIHLQVPQCEVFFRRAFSIYDVDREKRSLDLIFKVFGRGTTALAKIRKGEQYSILGPLGNSFAMPSKKEKVMLVAGGIGMPPMYFLTKQLIAKKHDPKRILFFYGGYDKADLVDIARIRKLGAKVIPVTENGSSGFKGLVTEAVLKELDGGMERVRMYACGPEPMLRAVDALAVERGIPGQVSLEAPMPCGIGICLGCVKELRAGGHTRVCREGPVYEMGEVVI